MPLPHFVLTDSQSRLLAELVLAPLPAAQGNGLARADEEAAARGLDPEATLRDLPRLVLLGLAVRQADGARATDLGTAVHLGEQLDAAQGRLGDVVRFAGAVEKTQPQLAGILRLLAQGDITLRAAVADAAASDRCD